VRAPDHGWARRRLQIHALHLLDEAEEARLEAHLAECDVCADLFDVLREPADLESESPDHIPSSLLARWPHVIAGIRGVERLALRSHLTRCADCRSDLQALGFEATLPVIDELEDRAADPTGEIFPVGGTAMRATTTVPQGESRERRPSRWLTWFLGGWGLVASTAALVLVSRVLPSPLLSSVAVLEPAIESRAVTAVAPEARDIAVRIDRESLEAPDATPVVVRLAMPDGRVLERHGSLADVSTPKMLVLHDGRGFASGEYRLLVIEPTAGDTLLDRTLEVRAAR
jgi:hypothetical protein